LGKSHTEKFIEHTENGKIKIKIVQFNNYVDDCIGLSVICNDTQRAYFENIRSTIINNRNVLMVTSGGK